MDEIPPSLLRKKGQTYISIGPELQNVTGFKSRMWNVVWDDRYVLVRWGPAVVLNNKVAPSYLQSKLHTFGSKHEAESKLGLLLRDKQSPKKGYLRIVSGYSLKPVSKTASLGARASTTSKRIRSEEPEVFISYAHRNRKTVFPIVRKLESVGINVWIDGDDMESEGAPFGVQIQRAIKNANSVAVMISRQSNESSWVALEATFAKRCEKPLIPFRIQSVNPIGVTGVQLAGIPSIRGYGSCREHGINDLITQVKSLR